MIARPMMIAASFVATFALAGCGKTGQLERPAPLFGEKAKADYRAQKVKEAADRAARSDARADSTVTTPDDPNRPLTQAPYAPTIPGGPSDPYGHGPQGALPSPGSANDR